MTDRAAGTTVTTRGPIDHGTDRTAHATDALSADDLRWFGAIAHAGSISEAARRFGASKATLSRAVARMEAVAGAPVFDRVGRGLRLTPLGETFKPPPTPRSPLCARRTRRCARRRASRWAGCALPRPRPPRTSS